MVWFLNLISRNCVKNGMLETPFDLMTKFMIGEIFLREEENILSYKKTK